GIPVAENYDAFAAAGGADTPSVVRQAVTVTDGTITVQVDSSVGQAGYSASKAAVSSIGEALRVEWAEKGIAVATLEPALTATGFFQAQENPRGLPDPDMGRAIAADDVAREVLELDRSPRPLRSLRWKWRILGALSVVAPRLADRALVGRLGGDWRTPER
ncbi:MAG: SDR family NAD(P)-dependent oxidoreductase, partial [Planctomycetota bacterium]